MMEMSEVEQVWFLLREADYCKKKIRLEVDEYENGGKRYFYSSKHYIYGLVIKERLRMLVLSKREVFVTEKYDLKSDQQAEKGP